MLSPAFWLPKASPSDSFSSASSCVAAVAIHPQLPLYSCDSVQTPSCRRFGLQPHLHPALPGGCHACSSAHAHCEQTELLKTVYQLPPSHGERLGRAREELVQQQYKGGGNAFPLLDEKNQYKG